MVPWSVPSFLLGLHVLQGVVVGVRVPPTHGTVSNTVDSLPAFGQSSVSLGQYMPRKRHLKPQRLLKRLGKEYDDFWMSKDLPEDVLEIKTKRNTDTSLIPESRSLELSNLIRNLYASSMIRSQNNGSRLEGNSFENISSSGMEEMARTLQSWLVDFSSCLVYYQWEDLGLLNWPRWVRKGWCSPPQNDMKSDTSSLFSSSSSLPLSSSSSASSTFTAKSCSWPPGMHCVPNKAKKLKILRWVCKPTKTSDLIQRFRESGRRRTAGRRPRASDIDNDDDNDDHNNEKPMDAGEIFGHKDDRDSKPFEMPFPNLKELVPSHSVKDIFDAAPGSTRKREKVHMPSTKSHRRPKKQTTRQGAKRFKSENVINKTEDWNKKKWNARQKRPHFKCRWARIPYPVIDDCYCSC